MSTKARTLGSAVSAGGVIQRDGAVKSYSSVNDLPSSPEIGEFAFVLSNQSSYMWNGTKWDRVYLGSNMLPEWTTEPNATYQLAIDGTPTTITTLATDPENFPISYSYDTNPSNQTQASIVNNNDGTFTVTPSTNDSDAGEFTLRIKATDGLHVSSKSSQLSLQFSLPITFNTEIAARGAGFIAGDDLMGTVYNSTTTSPSLVVRSDALRSGRRYFEMAPPTASRRTLQFGLTINRTNWHNSGPGVWTIYDDRVAIYPGDLTSYGGVSFTYTFPPSRYMVAYDTDTREVWFGINGSWLNGKNPDIGNSGFPLTGNPGDPVYTYAIGYYAIGNVNHTFYRNTGLQYTIPTGFTSH